MITLASSSLTLGVAWRAQVRRRGPARLRRAPPALLAPPPSPSPSPRPALEPCAARALLVFWGMTLPLSPPVLPQLARSAKTLPTGDGWSYEPKWDGFRSIAFVDGADVYLQSRNGKPLRALLPRAARSRRAATCSTARSCCSTTQGRQDFDALGQRIHPAESRIRHARRADADALHRVRPARRRRRVAARAARSTSAARGWSSWSTRRSTSRRRARSRRARRSGCRAPRAWWPSSSATPVPPGRARRHGEDQARPHDRRGRAWAGGPARRRARSAR